MIYYALILLALGFPQNDFVSGSKELMQYETAVASCELSALQLGSEIADVFNAPTGGEDWNERVHQDKIVEKLGFAPWTANGVYGTDGKTLQGNEARKIFDKAGWGEKNIAQSPYAYLENKWIYMFGDSTTRQVWVSFAAPFQPDEFKRNAKEWTRKSCASQTHRVRHTTSGPFDSEGWRGMCGVNEVTCHVSGYGDQGSLTFDWKHFPYEDYDEYLFGPEGPFVKGFDGKGMRRPDVLTVQFGMHSCFHADTAGYYSQHLTANNETMIEAHLASVPKLMRAMRQAVDAEVVLPPGASGGEMTKQTRTTVIVVTAGSVGFERNGLTLDACVQRFNHAATKAAQEFGFAVLDRAEIERRLMRKSTLSNAPIIAPNLHLPRPAADLVATSLLHLITCLDANASQFKINAEVLAARDKHTHVAPSPPKA